MPFTSAIHLAVACGLLAVWQPAVHAQNHAMPADQSRQAPVMRAYDIPAGPLETALARFADESGVLLTATPELVQGRQTRGLRGTFGAQAALDALLAGTGLEAQRNARGQYVLRAAERESATLSVVTVTAQGLSGENTTEGTGSYTTGSMSTATKLPLSIRETPQSVTVITRQRMDDQAIATASDVLKQAPGITTTASAPNRETYSARGFSVQNVAFDGLTVTGQWTRFGSLINDMAIYDRVEVVRGAAGLTQGAGEPSAAINFVRKRPTDEFAGYVQAQAGSWNHYNMEVDVSGPLNKAGSLRGRTVLSYTDADSFMDVVNKQNSIFYAIGEADISPNTLLTAGVSYQKTDSNNIYGGLPTALDGSDLHLPRSSYFGTKWNFWNDENTSVFASVEHRFDNGWKAKLATNQMRVENNLTMAGITYDSAAAQYDYGSGLQESVYRRASYDLNMSGPFALLGRQHDAVLGAEMRTADAHNVTAGYWPSPFYYYNVNIYNFDRDAIQSDPYSWTKDYFYTSEEKQSGLYGALRLNPTDWLKVIGGLRYSRYEFKDHADWYDQSSGGTLITWGDKNKDDYLIKYAGVVVDLDKRHSVYASYTDIFQIQTQRDVNNSQLDPIEGVNYEIGAKGEYFDGALNASAALFRVDQQNLAMATGPCPFRPTDTCYRAAGMVRSEGFDLEVNGSITPNWSVGGGYSYVAKRVEKDANPAAIGVRQDTHMPTRQLKLATSYKFLDDKARIGGGLRWQNRVWHYNNWDGYDYNTEQKAYAVADLMAGYRPTKNIDLQLNISNVFDKRYYSSINAQPTTWGGNTVYGEPRKLMLTAKYSF